MAEIGRCFQMSEAARDTQQKFLHAPCEDEAVEVVHRGLDLFNPSAFVFLGGCLCVYGCVRACVRA